MSKQKELDLRPVKFRNVPEHREFYVRTKWGYTKRTRIPLERTPDNKFVNAIDELRLPYYYRDDDDAFLEDAGKYAISHGVVAERHPGRKR